MAPEEGVMKRLETYFIVFLMGAKKVDGSIRPPSLSAYETAEALLLLAYTI